MTMLAHTHTPTTPAAREPFTVSNHSLGIILSCQRAGYFYKVLKRVKVREAKPGADAGSAVHSVLSAYYGGKDMATACQSLATHNAGEDYRTPTYLSEAMRAYERQWGDDRATFKTLAVELPFKLALNEWLTWDGRMDHIYLHPDGRVVVRDHKTSKDYGNSTLDEFETEPAMKGYVWAARQLLGRADIVTTELNAITLRKPLVKERADSKPRFEFHRAQFLVDDERVEEWRVNTIRVVTAFLEAVEHDDVGFNENSCVSFNSRCQYYDVCAQPVRQRRTLLMTDMYEDYKSRVASTND